MTMPLADYLGLLRQIARRAEAGTKDYLAAFERRCGRALTATELRQAMSDGDGDPVLMGLIRASHLRRYRRPRTTRRTGPLPGQGGSMKRCIVSAPLVLGLILGATGARAMDLGVIGPTYEISEPHLLQMIEQRLRAKERSGELGRLKRKSGNGASRP
jgi:hypothetical protein